jgi:hypothetical protein
MTALDRLSAKENPMPNGLNPLPSFIRASAQDAGDMHMRAAGRSKWNDDDWNRMCEVQERLIRSLYGRASDHNQPDYCYIRFHVAEQLERAGHLTLKSNIAAAVDEILGDNVKAA